MQRIDSELQEYIDPREQLIHLMEEGGPPDPTTETELHRLTEDGRRLVGESFMKGETTLTDE